MPSNKSIYRTPQIESFPEKIEILFDNNERLTYTKVGWRIGDQHLGLRYGDNPDQPAALYRLTNGSATLVKADNKEATIIARSDRPLTSGLELIQSGKHPGKINITDVDSGLNILRYLHNRPTVTIIKHNNPCGVATGKDIEQAYRRAYDADRVASFGGVVVLNRAVDKILAEQIVEHYSEVIAAPDYSENALQVFQKRKNLRVIQIGAIQTLGEFVDYPALEWKGLIDGGLIVQLSQKRQIASTHDFRPASCIHKGKVHSVVNAPTQQELDDLFFGWQVECGISSNSIIYVKNGMTLGIATGEQDRVGAAMIARDKAYRKLVDRLCDDANVTNSNKRQEIIEHVKERKGDLPGSCMISDAFFPFRDGIDVAIAEGIRAVAQPGGSIRDYEAIEACNENNIAMVFSGQRIFRH